MVSVLAITEDDIKKVQQQWAAAMIDIGSVFQNGGGYRKIAGEYFDRLYGYAIGSVLFKPTRAAVNQFRTTRKGELKINFHHSSMPWQHVA